MNSGLSQPDPEGLGWETRGWGPPLAAPGRTVVRQAQPPGTGERAGHGGGRDRQGLTGRGNPLVGGIVPMEFLFPAGAFAHLRVFRHGNSEGSFCLKPFVGHVTPVS